MLKKLKIFFFLFIFFQVFLINWWSLSSLRQIYELSTIFDGFQYLGLIKNWDKGRLANIKIKNRLLKLPFHPIFWISKSKWRNILYTLISLYFLFTLTFLWVINMSSYVNYEILVISCVSLQLILESLIINIPFLSNCGNKVA